MFIERIGLAWNENSFKQDISYSKQLSHAVLTTTVLTSIKLPLELMQLCTTHLHSVYQMFLFCVHRTSKLVRIWQKGFGVRYFPSLVDLPLYHSRKGHLTSQSFIYVARAKKYLSQSGDNKLPQAFLKGRCTIHSSFAVTSNYNFQLVYFAHLKCFMMLMPSKP